MHTTAVDLNPAKWLIVHFTDGTSKRLRVYKTTTADSMARRLARVINAHAAAEGWSVTK